MEVAASFLEELLGGWLKLPGDDLGLTSVLAVPRAAAPQLECACHLGNSLCRKLRHSSPESLSQYLSAEPCQILTEVHSLMSLVLPCGPQRVEATVWGGAQETDAQEDPVVLMDT